MGMVFTILSFAVLSGVLIAGHLIMMKGGGYGDVQFSADTDMLIGYYLLIADCGIFKP
jgi:hypothetical protein